MKKASSISPGESNDIFCSGRNVLQRDKLTSELANLELSITSCRGLQRQVCYLIAFN